MMGDSSESVTGAIDGLTSSATTSATSEASTSAGESASPALLPVMPSSRIISGWVCDDANPFGHSVCRSVTAQVGDWPTSIVLTAGDGCQESTTLIDVPPDVLRWLLKGE